MLIALMTILFLGGGTQDAVLDFVKEMQGNVKEIVEDKERRSAINDTLKAMKKHSKERGKTTKKTLRSLFSDMSGHEVNEAGVDAVFDEYLASLTGYNEDMIDLRFQLREQLTRDEWEALFVQGEQ